MINTVLHLQGQFSRSIGFDKINLYLSSLQFAEIEGLRNECLTANKRASPKVPLHSIRKIVFDDLDDAVTVYFFKDSGKKKSYFVEGFDPNLKSLFAHDLAKAAGLSNEGQEGQKTRNFSKHYLSIVGTILGTALIAWVAESSRTGRRSQMVRLAQNLGAGGICIIGGLFLLGILYLMYKQTRQPASKNSYSR